MKSRFKIQMFTGLTAFAFYLIAAKLFNDFIYVFEKEEIAALTIGVYLLIMVVAGWINDYAYSSKTKTDTFSFKSFKCTHCGKVIGFEDPSGNGKITSCGCRKEKSPERKKGYDYCEKCNKELGKTLPAGSGYRGGCDCGLSGTPPGQEKSILVDESAFIKRMSFFIKNYPITEDKLIDIARLSSLIAKDGKDAIHILKWKNDRCCCDTHKNTDGNKC